MGQFAIPAAILGVGVIGLWLMGGKKSTTSKPDSMPKLNSGLRGTTMPVTFGTNKVSAQITWSKNWNPQRQRSPGKGKGGGSGGFGSAKGGGAAGQQYLYYWDLMFHYGMFDTPSLPVRGWVGADKIDPVVMEALTSGGSTTLLALIPISTLIADKSATLSYTAAFIGQGYPTGDASLTSWGYFQAQEHVNCAFPYTGWVGFEQLALGQTPSVPQLFFEWVPLSASQGFTPSGGFLSKGVNPTHQLSANPTFVTGDNNINYIVGDGGSGGAILACRAIDGSTTATRTSAQFNTDLTTFFTGLGFSWSVGSHWEAYPVGGKYFYVDFHPGSLTVVKAILVYEVNTDGTISVVGGSYYTGCADCGLGANIARPAYGVGQLSTGEILVLQAGTFDHQPTALALHSPTSILGIVPVVDVWNNRQIVITEPITNDFMTPGSNRIGYTHLASVIGNSGYYYFGKAEMDWQAAHTSGAGFNDYLKSIQPTYPNGVLIQVDFSFTGGVLTYTWVGPVSKFGVPHTDVQLDSTGAAGTAYDDYTVPLAAGSGLSRLVFVTRPYSDNKLLARTNGYLDFDGSVLGSFSSTFAAASDFGNHLDNIMITLPSGGSHLYVVGLSSGDGQVVATFAGLGENALDVTPAYIIYRILTHPAFGLATAALFGFTVTEARIDQNSYLNAVAECINQGCLISVTYDNTGNVLDIFNDLLSLYGGYLTESDGIVKFGVVRATDTPIRVIDNNHLVAERGKPPVKVSKAALDDGYNKVSITYLDRALDYNQNQVFQSDEVDMDLNGPRPKDWNTRYVMPGSLANQIAVRALWSNLYGRDTYEFQTGWKDFDLRPGDLVTLVDSFDPMLSAGARIRLLKRGATNQVGSYKWQAVQDYQYINTASAVYSNIASISGGAGSVVEPAQAPLWQTAYEVSREFQGSKAELYFGYGQASRVMGAQLHVSRDGTNYLLAQDVQPYIISGIVAHSLENRPKGYVEDKIDFWIFPQSGFNASTPTFVQTYALDDITPALREAGAGVLIVGSEAMSLQTLTLLGQNHYSASKVFRGWGGTPVSGHSSGEHFHAHGSGIFAFEITTDDVGTNLSYKIAPYNFAGHAVDVTSLTASSYAIKGNYWLAREQPFTRLWVNSAITQPRSTSLKGPYVGVTSGGCDLIASWPRADNAEGFGAGGFGAGSFGHFIMADSVGWRVDVYSSNGAAVSSFVVNTGYFDYTVAQNSTDFNGFGRDLVLRITPFTVKGDGPVTDTRSVSLNW